MLVLYYEINFHPLYASLKLLCTFVIGMLEIISNKLVVHIGKSILMFVAVLLVLVVGIA